MFGVGLVNEVWTVGYPKNRNLEILSNALVAQERKPSFHVWKARRVMK